MDQTVSYSKNIVQAHIDSNGNVIVGDGNTIVNLKEATQYKAIVVIIEDLKERFEKAKLKREQYPDDPDFGIEMLKIDDERRQKQVELEELKKSVIELAQEFQRIPINTERLRKAKEHFERGEFAEARALFNAEKELMERELKDLKKKEVYLEEQLKETQDQLADKANEYLIFARLTAMNFDHPNRFEQTLAYFNESLSASKTIENVLTFAFFLQEHNQFSDAKGLYEIVLNLNQKTLDTSSEQFKYNKALVLSNISILYRNNNNLQASINRIEIAIGIYEELVVQNSKYLPKLAESLNNYAVLHADNQLYEKAIEIFIKLLGIYKKLSRHSLNKYQPNIAFTLNNLGNCYRNINLFIQAKNKYEESIRIYRILACEDGNRYLQDLAMILLNFAVLYQSINRNPDALQKYEEAITIYEKLANDSPHIHFHGLANTLNNVASLYSNIGKKYEAIERFNKALQIIKDLQNNEPLAYKKDLASIYLNRANHYFRNDQLNYALSDYEQAQNIYGELFVKYSPRYGHELVRTLVNISIFYTKGIPNKENAVTYALEVLKIAQEYPDILYLNEFIEKTKSILNENGFISEISVK